jgi:hypothetical protein
MVVGFSLVVATSVVGASFGTYSLSVSMRVVGLLMDWLSLVVVDCCCFASVILIFFFGIDGDELDSLDRFDFDGDFFVVLVDFDFDGGCFGGDASVKLITSVGLGILGGMFFCSTNKFPARTSDIILLGIWEWSVPSMNVEMSFSIVLIDGIPVHAARKSLSTRFRNSSLSNPNEPDINVFIAAHTNETAFLRCVSNCLLSAHSSRALDSNMIALLIP